MGVDVEGAGVADHQQRFAARGDERPLEAGAIERGAAHDVLRAVAVTVVFDGREVDVAGRRRGRVGKRRAGQPAVESPQQDGDPHAPGVDDARLAQPGQQRRGPLEARLGLAHDALEGGRDRGLTGGRGRARAGRVTHHRQHRSLDGIADRLVGRPGCLNERLAETVDVGVAAPGEPLRDPAQHLREDDAAVAPGAEQGALGERLSVVADAALRTRPRRVERGAVREQHVSAGVAVRHRVDVDGVDGVAVRHQPALGHAQGGVEGGGVDPASLTHRRTPPGPGCGRRRRPRARATRPQRPMAASLYARDRSQQRGDRRERRGLRA